MIAPAPGTVQQRGDRANHAARAPPTARRAPRTALGGSTPSDPCIPGYRPRLLKQQPERLGAGA